MTSSTAASCLSGGYLYLAGRADVAAQRRAHLLLLVPVDSGVAPHDANELMGDCLQCAVAKFDDCWVVLADGVVERQLVLPQPDLRAPFPLFPELLRQLDQLDDDLRGVERAVGVGPQGPFTCHTSRDDPSGSCQGDPWRCPGWSGLLSLDARGVVVLGEAGVGKSRVLRLSATASASGDPASLHVPCFVAPISS